MPIHEYVCGQCGQEFEELVRSSAQAVSCPECGSETLQRKLSTFAAMAASPNECRAAETCPRGSCCSGGACNLGG